MKSKTTLLLLVAAIGLAVWIKFYESKRPNTEETQRRAGTVLKFEPDQLEGIVIQNGDDKIELRKTDGKWRVEAPIKDQADASAVGTLVSDLESWEKSETITAAEIEADKTRLAEYRSRKAKAAPEIAREGDAAGNLFREGRGTRETNVCPFRELPRDLPGAE